MPLTGKDVWEAIVKLGLMSGPYDPKTNRYCANADRIAALLNEVLAKQESGWLPNVMQTEDAMRRQMGADLDSHIRTLPIVLTETASPVTVPSIESAPPTETASPVTVSPARTR